MLGLGRRGLCVGLGLGGMFGTLELGCFHLQLRFSMSQGLVYIFEY